MKTVETKVVMTDQFSASFSQYLAMAQLAKSQTDSVNTSVEMLGQNMGGSVGGAAGLAANNMRQLNQQTSAAAEEGFSNMQAQASRVVEITKTVIEEEKRHQSALQSSVLAAQRLYGSIKGIASAAVGKLKMAAPAIELSDSIVRMNAKLELIHDGSQTTQELQESIYESAQRVRMPYLDMADMVSGLGGALGEVFSSNDETAAFAENFSKLFTIAGAGQEEIKSAAQKLIQALSDGTLQGEELNSVFKTAPNAVQAIADSLGVGTQTLKEMAANGEISAEVLKNAMLAATGEINQSFDDMPMTWGQAWTNMKSAAVKALQPAFEKLNEFLNSDTGKGVIDGVTSSFGALSDIASGAVDLLSRGAAFIAENWEYIWPIIAGIGTAFAIAGVIATVSGLAAAASWILAALPFLLIGAAIGILILLLQQAGVTFEQAGSAAGTVFGFLYAVIYNTVANLWNIIAVFIEFLVNVFNDPVAAIAHLFYDLFDGILQAVENVAQAIDAVMKTDMSGAVSGFRENLSDWVSDTYGENETEIKRMAQIDMVESARAGGETGSQLGAKLDGLGSGLALTGGGTAGRDYGKDAQAGLLGGAAGNEVKNVGKVGEVSKLSSAEDVNIADEDIKLLQDLSERQYVALVNLTAPSPISISQNNYGAPGGNIEDVAAQLARLLEQQRSNKPTVVYG